MVEDVILLGHLSSVTSEFACAGAHPFSGVPWESCNRGKELILMLDPWGHKRTQTFTLDDEEMASVLAQPPPPLSLASTFSSRNAVRCGTDLLVMST